MSRNFKQSLLMAITFLIALSTFAQKSIVLCTEYDESGKPSGVYSTWDLKGEKSYIYILYDNGGEPITGTAYIYIDYIWSPGEDYKPYETVEVTNDAKGKTWLVHDQEWKDAGDYRIQFKINGVTQATTFAKLIADPNAGKSSDDGEVDTYYYENSEILFGTGIDSNNELVGESTEFELDSKGSTEVTVYITMDNPFKTNSISVELYESASNNKVEEFALEIQPEWDWIKFKQIFNKAGEYYMDIYNAEDIFINTATVKITK